MHELELVVFDIAGTTIQASDQVPAAFRKAFELQGVNLSDEQIRTIRGQSKREAISALLNSHFGENKAQGLSADVYDDFQRILIERYETQGVESIAGAGETIEWLKTRNVKVALTTGFDRDLAKLLLSKVDWGQSIDVLVCNEDVPRGRPAPYLLFRAMEWTRSDCVRRVAAVGDTVSDLQTAANAGVGWGIGVLSGAHDETQLRSCPHSALIASVKELPGVFE